MITTKRASALSGLLIAGSLSACSSSSNGNAEASFDELSDRGYSLMDRIESLDATPVEGMPVEGAATYRGIAGFAVDYVPESPEELEVLSELTLRADFSDSSISGEMNNFRDYENAEVDGTLAITNGAIAGNEFTADADGTLVADGVRGDVSADMYGAFGGEDAEVVAGIMEGEISTSDGDLDVYGIFGGAR